MGGSTFDMCSTAAYEPPASGDKLLESAAIFYKIRIAFPGFWVFCVITQD
jgi:hypothetical protein